MIRLLLLLGFCLGLGRANAQAFALSDEFPLPRNSDYALIGAIADTSYLLLEQANQFEVKAFGPDMKPLWTRPLDLELRNAVRLSATVSREGFTVVYARSYQGGTRVEAARCDAGARVDTVYRLLALPGREDLYPENAVLSEDRTKVLVWAVLPGFDLIASCFDLATGKALWEHKMAGNYRLFEQDFEQAVVGNDGVAWLVFGENNRKNRAPTAFRMDRLGMGVPTTFRAGMAGKHWTSVRFAVDNLNGKLIGAGLYADKYTVSAKGSFNFAASLSGKDSVVVHFDAFTPEFVAGLTGKKVRKRVVGVPDLKVRELVLRRDGGLLLVAEQFRFFVRRANPSPTFYGRVIPGDTQTDYYYDDLLLLSFNPDGGVHWRQVLYKRQVSRDDNGFYSSYFLMKARANLRFLYNDDIRAATNVNEYIVNAKGEFERKSILETGKDKLALSLRNAVQIGPSALLVVSERRNDLRLVKIQY
jgi:hypothetical protein